MLICTPLIHKLLSANTMCCCWTSVMLHCSMNFLVVNFDWWGSQSFRFLSNSQNSYVKSPFAETSCLSTRLQLCWHLWKWSELGIRGFVTNPICHLPKWSQIPACTVGLYTSSSERMMSYTRFEAIYRYTFYFLMLIVTGSGIWLKPLNELFLVTQTAVV